MKFIDYIRGLRNGKDAHQIEHNSMSDPFLSDAIDGYDSVNGNHNEHIARMQTRISSLTTSDKTRKGAWKIAAAATIVITLMGGYFTLMNHRTTMLSAHKQDNSYINIYAPEAYIERKSLELAEIKETASDNNEMKLTAVVDISNLNEVIKPAEKGLRIYVPEHYAQLRKQEIEELSSSKAKTIKDNLIRETNVIPAASPTLAITSAAPSVIACNIEEPTEASDINKQINTSVTEALSGKAAGIAVAESKPVGKSKKETTTGKSIGSKKIALSGKIVDQNNEPVIGATVYEKGTSNGTVTDLDGNYSIMVDSGNADLIANLIGYETVEIPKAKDNQIIALKESTQTLDEVVVTGYGTTKRKDITGAVSVVSAEKKSIRSKDVTPRPIIGNKEYKSYIESNIKRPADANCEKQKGKVVLKFNVNTQGRPVNIIVKKSLCEDLDKEAVRLVESGPDWTYGTTQAKVEVKF